MSKEEQEKYMDWYRLHFRDQLKQYEDPVMEAVVKSHMMWWFGQVDAVIRAFGEEGKKVVTEAHKQSAIRYAEYVKQRHGKDLYALIMGYSEGYRPGMRMYAEPIWDVAMDLPKKVSLKMICHKGYLIKELMSQDPKWREIGRMWCVWDAYLAEAFNPKIKYRLAKWIPDGDLYCQHIWELEN